MNERLSLGKGLCQLTHQKLDIGEACTGDD